MIKELYNPIINTLINQKRYNNCKMIQQNFAIFVDYSGSVGGCTNYWDAVNQVLTTYAKDISHYYFWDSYVRQSNKKQYQEFIVTKRGMGGTSPQHVATEIVNKKFQNIILITDGQVGDYSVQACDKTFEQAKNKEKFKLNKSICYIIGGSYGDANLSVTCPFTRYCENKVFTRNGSNPLKEHVSYTPQDYKLLDTLDEISLENFQTKYDTIEGVIIAQNMGKESNIPLKNQLVVMKNRLIKELSKKMGKQFDFTEQMRKNLKINNPQGAMEVANKMVQSYGKSNETSVLQEKISHLINLCGDLRGKYNLGQIKSNKIQNAKTAEQGKLEQAVQIQDLSKNPIECPIIMDQDVPQILIDQCEPLLVGIQKGVVDDICACPLRILNYPEIKKKLKARLSNFMGVKFSDKFLKNPFTQNRLLGAIPLGSHKTHVTVGNHAIAKMIAGGKILGNIDMYYAVIWYIINEGQIQYLNDIKANVTEHLIYRLKNHVTMASLCGMSQYVSTQIKSDVAVWYCVNSGFFNQPTDKDSFRFHFYNYEPMVKICQALGYPLHPQTEKHYLRTKCMINLLAKYKRSSPSEKKSMKNLFKGLYQNGYLCQLSTISKKVKETEVISTFIPLDGKASKDQIKKIRKSLPSYTNNLSKEELYHISTLLDQNKSGADIFMDFNLVVLDLPQSQVNWFYGLNQDQTVVKINPNTLRPFYNPKSTTVTWQSQAQEIYKVDKTQKLFKGNKYLIDFIIKYDKLPTESELLTFYYNREIESDKSKTLPFQTIQWASSFIASYKEILENGNSKKMIKELKESVKISNRKKMENA